MVVFVCFFRGADDESVKKAAVTVTQDLKLCEPDEPSNKRVSVADLEGGSLLVVPQATLGAKLKGRGSLQYHGNVDKEEGQRLFELFCMELRVSVEEISTRGVVKNGMYGARQVLSMETNGPFTHVFEL